MCYNLLNPLVSKKQNSILDVDELSQYLNVTSKYPLHLDIALPNLLFDATSSPIRILVF
ncbi:hypothetical protein [uncultured Flavobacterium sp.]|uniref:hypothetical protein n=1 Tax=uncultured Flavobacterium sp. TaxID=165435 RepID=UPI0030CA16C2